MFKLFKFLVFCFVVVVTCDNNPIDSTANDSNIIGTWIVAHVVEDWEDDYNGEKSYHDSSYNVDYLNEESQIYIFTKDSVYHYFKDGGDCFESIKFSPYTIENGRLKGLYWQGLEIEDGYSFKYETEIRKDGNNLVMTYIETEGASDEGEYYSSKEIWIYTFEPYSLSFPVDSINSKIDGCKDY